MHSLICTLIYLNVIHRTFSSIINKLFTGVENGLKLRLNVEQYEYMPGPHDAAGIKLLIHDSFEMPRVYALGQAVSTGSNVFAGVKLLKVC